MVLLTRWRVVALICLLAVVGVAALTADRVRRLDREALHLAESGQAAIRLLGELGTAIKHRDAEAIAALYAADVRGAEAGSWRMASSSERDGVTTSLWEPATGGPSDPRAMAAGWLEWLGDPEKIDLFKLKLGRITDLGAEGSEIRAFVWLKGHDAEGARESRMWLRMRVGGVAPGPGTSWTISEQELLSGETVQGAAVGFTDVALDAGVDFVPRHNPNFATDEWFPHKFGIIRYGSAGVSAADYDGDGWDDLFFADGAGPRLYRNLGNGSFADVTEAAGLPGDLEGVNVALFVDLDNDGDRDLFLGAFTSANRLFRNDGDGTFTDVTEGAGLGGELAVVATAGDVDGDGLVDLYVGRYLDPRVDLPTTLFYTRNGGANSLLRNLGDLRFEDVTERTGTGDTGLSLGVAFADYDHDGDQDLYVANDFGRNTMLRNDGGTFTDISAEADALDFGYGMSATWADFDNDRDFDMYVSNVHSGQRWYGQATMLYKYLLTSLRQGTFFEDFGVYREVLGFAGSDWRSYGDRVVKGSSLLRNDGDRFVDISEDAGANPFGWYWGAAALDFDHDGWLDIYGANGWISAADLDDL